MLPALPLAVAVPGLDTLLDLVVGPRGTGVANPCTEGQQVCTTVWEWSGNSRLAAAADLVIGTPLQLVGYLVLALVVRWVVHRLIGRVVLRAEKGPAAAPGQQHRSTRRTQRAQTVGSLLKSVSTGVITAVVGTMMLSEIGVNIAPIIASAGIIGIAVGFGAQSLVADFLSGIFMIVEDQYGVGDVVDLGEAIGTVEAVTLRITRVRDINGTVWYVPNGSITRVGNQSQNWAQTVLDVTVGYDEDLARVRSVLESVAHDLWEDEAFEGKIIEEPSVWGVQNLGPDGVDVRVVLKTAPLEQWAVAREMRQRIKARFDAEGIEIPNLQRMMWRPGGEAAADQPASGT
ncbi:mechanosensitive ion channel family protein [Nocardioides sp. AX2bis]|uniref:mechanosensitive ion channel family protein n=1 Tax=Nocardioides sp. AX2bis TaxID=2653157 RepID=UPI0012F3FD81|nr:mechanosensitive ion channel family protein [Nocardioides sp. AX2bis]VXB86934.1 Small conductance mechanosensitive channel [Nocardioides sp. AX2bis]